MENQQHGQVEMHQMQQNQNYQQVNPQQQQYQQQQYYQQQPMMQQQQPMMMQPNMQMQQQQQMMMGGQPMMMAVQVQMKPIFGMDKLALLKGVFVKQKFELLEAITGCETENKYEIFGIKDDGDKDKKNKLFKAKEKSGFCERQFLNGDCRPFKLRIEHDSDLQNDGQMFIECDRECKCTCLCLNRPTMNVNFVEGGQKKQIGSVFAPWKFCELQVDIRDSNQVTVYTIKGNCCQLGIWCANYPCEPCQTVDFFIFDAKGEKTDGFLQKRTKGCLKAALGDADNFSLTFPSGCTTENKALLTCSVIFLDFRYFEDKQKNNNNNNRALF